MTANQGDLLGEIFDIEESFYKEGYDLGLNDGAEAGYAEGSIFGVEKAFEKFLEVGRLYGKALVWAQRLSNSSDHKPSKENNAAGLSLGPSLCEDMKSMTASSRLAKNLGILLEILDPASLVMQNTEEAVNDTDERLKGAIIKAKLIQRSLGEREDTSDLHTDAKDFQLVGDGSGSIEDISSLKVRH